jgi:hypothetical protein
MLEFSVDGRRPGSPLDVKPGASVRVVARAIGHATQVPLRRLQIIAHGRVLREVQADAAGASRGELAIEFDLRPEHGMWIAARADAGPDQMAHTTPVYVTVNGDGFHTRTNLAARIETTRTHLHELRQQLVPPATPVETQRVNLTPPPWRYPSSSRRLEERIVESERKLEALSRGR